MQWVVIADEITAVGWRLAGAQVQTPDARSAAECFSSVQRSADLVFITAALAQHLPVRQLQSALLAQRPLLLVIADLGHRREPPDIEEAAIRALGVAV